LSRAANLDGTWQVTARKERNWRRAAIARYPIAERNDVVTERKVSVERRGEECVRLGAHQKVLKPLARVEIRHVVVVHMCLDAETPFAMESIANDVLTEEHAYGSDDIDGK